MSVTNRPASKGSTSITILALPRTSAICSGFCWGIVLRHPQLTQTAVHTVQRFGTLMETLASTIPSGRSSTTFHKNRTALYARRTLQRCAMSARLELTSFQILASAYRTARARFAGAAPSSARPARLPWSRGTRAFPTSAAQVLNHAQGPPKPEMAPLVGTTRMKFRVPIAIFRRVIRIP